MHSKKLIVVATLLVLGIMMSCGTQKGGCKATEGFVGFGRH
jgi:hypothetical protein